MSAISITQAGGHNVNPPRNAATVTPSDDDELEYESRAVLIGNTAGNIAVVMADGDEVTIPVAANQWLPIQVKQVKETGTTATTITVFW